MSTQVAKENIFDEELPAFEDWDFFARLAVLGFQGVRLAAPLLYVRISETGRRAEAMKRKDELINLIQARYKRYAEGELTMGSCCGPQGAAVMAAKAALGDVSIMNQTTELASLPNPTVVRMEFIGPQRGAASYGGPGATPSGKIYRGGNNVFEKYADVDPRDVEWLLRSGLWKVIVNPAAPVQEQQVIEPERIADMITQITKPTEETSSEVRGVAKPVEHSQPVESAQPTVPTSFYGQPELIGDEEAEAAQKIVDENLPKKGSKRK